MTTVVKLGEEMLARIRDAREIATANAKERGDKYDQAAREYALAATHLEDAMMRFTRGKAHELEVFKAADLEDMDAVRERHDWTGKVLATREEEHGRADG